MYAGDGGFLDYLISFIDDDKSAVCKALMLEKKLDNFGFVEIVGT